jgi:hypothetical protein
MDISRGDLAVDLTAVSSSNEKALCIHVGDARKVETHVHSEIIGTQERQVIGMKTHIASVGQKSFRTHLAPSMLRIVCDSSFVDGEMQQYAHLSVNY